MTRIALTEPVDATGEAKALLDAVEKKMGIVPNITRALAAAPAVLKGYLDFSGALAGSSLSPKLRERIALHVAEINSCGYCLSAHSAVGARLGLSGDDIGDSRRGVVDDVRIDAVLTLARTIVIERGRVRDEDLRAARDAGLTDEAIVEVLGVTVLNVFTNWFNHLAETPVDFPEVEPGIHRS